MIKTLLALLLVPLMAFGAEPKTIVLTDDNSAVLRDAVTWNSVSKLQLQLLRLSATLREDEPIYLVLDTPGGSVSAGEMLIETLKGIKQPVHAIVLFAASMGFQITQASDRRFITDNGTLMSHRATLKLSGQLNGELESRLNMIKDIVSKMEKRSAKRIGVTLVDYNAKILNEWWEQGDAAVKANVADEVVILSCDKRLLDATVFEKVMTFFGPVNLEFSGCPLISTPVSVGGKGATVVDRLLIPGDIQNYIELLYGNKVKFVKDYVIPGKFN